MNDDADDVISWRRHAYSSYLGDFLGWYGMQVKIRGIAGLGGFLLVISHPHDMIFREAFRPTTTPHHTTSHHPPTTQSPLCHV